RSVFLDEEARHRPGALRVPRLRRADRGRAPPGGELPLLGLDIPDRAASRGAVMIVAEGFPTRILIVDDKEHVRESLRALVSLESRLYRVYTAANGPEALSILDREPVDVVLCDQVLTPEMSGTAVTGAIKERHPGVRVVVFTGKDVPKDTKVEVLEAGALF